METPPPVRVGHLVWRFRVRRLRRREGETHFARRLIDLDKRTDRGTSLHELAHVGIWQGLLAYRNVTEEEFAQQLEGFVMDLLGRNPLFREWLFAESHRADTPANQRGS